MRFAEGQTHWTINTLDTEKRLIDITSADGYQFILKGVVIDGEQKTVVVDDFSITPITIFDYNIDDLVITDDAFSFIKTEVMGLQANEMYDLFSDRLQELLTKEDFEILDAYIVEAWDL